MSLHEWYNGREVLITGVTSQLGQNLLEKLLRSFTSLKIHAVLRSRNGMKHRDRVKKRIFGSPGYERLRTEQPNSAENIVTYEGNLMYKNLGLRLINQQAMKNVSLVFHAGGPYTELLEYCKQLPNLQVVAVVTDLLSCTEHQIHESCSTGEIVPEGLTVAIVRLPPLGPAYREPMPGYVELFKGATAMMVGAGYIRGRGDLPAEIIPVDIATNTLITAARDVVLRSKLEKVQVYNAPSINCSWYEIISKGDRANKKFRYPIFRARGITSITIWHWIIVLLYEWLPSMLSDLFLYICRQKTRMMEQHERVRKILKDFESATLRIAVIERRKIKDIQGKLTTEDLELFLLSTDIDVEAYILCAAAAVRRYCVNEDNLRIVRFFLPTFLAFLILGCGCYYYYYCCYKSIYIDLS